MSFLMLSVRVFKYIISDLAPDTLFRHPAFGQGG